MAIENGPFIVDVPLKIVIFHSHVSFPEGRCTYQAQPTIFRRKTTIETSVELQDGYSAMRPNPVEYLGALPDATRVT